MPNDVEVIMDGGGAICQQGSSDRLYTGNFGGCTAIYAYTDKGLFGLYHLKSTAERPSDTIENLDDGNEPYRKWIKALKAQAGDDTIHFQLGTPWQSAHKNDFIRRQHPDMGMGNYLKTLCHQFGIENYDIAMMNMLGVKTVVVDQHGMTGRNIQNHAIQIPLAQYQTDEDLFEHSGLTTKQCLTYVESFPNVDFDGNLLEKYKNQFNKEQIALKQKEIKAKLQAKKDEANAIKVPLLSKVNGLLNQYEQKMPKNQDFDEDVMREYIFVKVLLRAVEFADLDVLHQLESSSDFKQIIEKESNNGKIKQIEKSELGQLFDEVKSKITQIDKILSEAPANVEENDNGLALN